ncbi:MAG: Uncharacterized protein FD169_2217 [Bacillota bacterium]|nr:MAG: Uncharacterized protein FD169_2217 [Bacillota bacterium]
MTQKLLAIAYAYGSKPNPLEQEIIGALQGKAKELAIIREGRYTRSQDIEKCLQPGLNDLGFIRSATVRHVAGLFATWSDFEIDFFHPELKVAIEVEKGKHFNLWRNLVKFCESPLVEHGVLLVPYQRTGLNGSEFIFSNMMDSLKNVEALYGKVSSVLCFGY